MTWQPLKLEPLFLNSSAPLCVILTTKEEVAQWLRNGEIVTVSNEGLRYCGCGAVLPKYKQKCEACRAQKNVRLCEECPRVVGKGKRLCEIHRMAHRKMNRGGNG